MAEPTAAELLVFADDWGRHPSSCQHLVRQLLAHAPAGDLGEHDRHAPPRLDLATLRAGWRSCGSGPRRQRPSRRVTPAEPRSAQPADVAVVPLARRRGRNRAPAAATLAPLRRSLPTPPVVVTTLPIVADLVGRLPVARWVYYCVDDFAEWPGLDGRTLRRMEEDLVAAADVADRRQRDAARAHSRGGPDVAPAHARRRSRPLGEPATRPHARRRARRPRAAAGRLLGRDRPADGLGVPRAAGATTWRRGRSCWSGPEQDPDPAPAAAAARGTLPAGAVRADCPALAREAAVLVMPYADLPVTRAMQPLKLKEYLATGRPVVVRDLPATRAWADCLDLAGTPEGVLGGRPPPDRDGPTKRPRMGSQGPGRGGVGGEGARLRAMDGPSRSSRGRSGRRTPGASTGAGTPRRRGRSSPGSSTPPICTPGRQRGGAAATRRSSPWPASRR